MMAGEFQHFRQDSTAQVLTTETLPLTLAHLEYQQPCGTNGLRGSHGDFLTVFVGFFSSRWTSIFHHQTFQVPKMEVLTYISCM